MARVIVSSGHTSQSPGTVANGLREVDLTRAISKKVIPYLRANGLITLAVPPNLPLQNRIQWINGTGYSTQFNDISIEIHVNDGGKSGFEFWFGGKETAKSQNLAQDIMDEVTQETGLDNQGINPHTNHEFGSLAFINDTNTISLILECLYIDNPIDVAKLTNEAELDKIGKGIAKGILKFLNVPYQETPKSFKQPRKTVPAINTNTTPANKYSQHNQNLYNQINQTQTSQQKINNSTPTTNTKQHTQINPIKTNSTSTTTPKKQDFQTIGNNTQSPPPYIPPTPTGQNTGSTLGTPTIPTISGSGNQNSDDTKPEKPISRDERKNMVIKNYKKILGREPNQNDLNYFLNIGITEDKLIKRMVDSQEHLDMVKANQEYQKLKANEKQRSIELTKLRGENEDRRIMQEKLTQLLHKKNAQIAHLRTKVSILAQNQKGANKDNNKKKEKGSLSDRFFHFFSDILG